MIDLPFEYWRQEYFDAPKNSEAAADALDNMGIMARTKADWSELFRIATSEENLPLNHPFVVVCTNGIGFCPESVSNERFRRWKNLPLIGDLVRLFVGPTGRVLEEPITHL